MVKARGSGPRGAIRAGSNPALRKFFIFLTETQTQIGLLIGHHNRYSETYW